MDKQLLNALENIGSALDALVDALSSNGKSEDSKSSVEIALQSGKFEKQLESISNSIKSIKVDTTKILKNQQTIIEQGKDKKTGPMEVDSKKENEIKKGVAVIMLIALAVLAIGMAFKIVGGGVSFISAVAVSLSITILAVAFEKIAKLKLNIDDAKKISVILVIISAALLASGLILSMIPNISVGKLATAVLIATGFAVISPAIVKIIKGISSIGFINLIKGLIFLPFILPTISLGIAMSSWVLSMVAPVGIAQAATAILIAGVFSVISYGVRNLLRAFRGISPLTIIMAAIFLPVILGALSKSIYDASLYLGGVKPIGISAFFGSIMVAVVFAAMSYSIKNILRGFRGVTPVQAAIAAVTAPLLLIALSFAVSESSSFLSNVKLISLDQFLTSLGISVIFIALSFLAKRIIEGVRNINAKDLVVIPTFFTVMSLTIMISSHILSRAVIIPLKDMLNIGLFSIGLVGISVVFAMGIKIISKVGKKELFNGGIAILGVSAIIMASSHILSVGKYKNYPNLDWAKGVSLSLLTFGLGAVALGFAVFGPQALLLAAGLAAIAGVSLAIVGVAEILSKGNYVGGPNEKWAKGISLSIGAFIPLYKILLAGEFLKKFFSMDVSPERFASVVKLISQGIVDSAVLFANYKGAFAQGPPESWAKGVSLALSSFLPIYGMLLKSEVLKIIGIKVSPEDFNKAIGTVIGGIVYAANMFNESRAVFASYPSVDWSNGVSKSIGAFASIFDTVSQSFFGGNKIESIGSGIKSISDSIVYTALSFQESNVSWDVYPKKEWSDGVSRAVREYVYLANFVKVQKPIFRLLKNAVESIVNNGRLLYNNNYIFSKVIPMSWSTSTNIGMRMYITLVNFATRMNPMFASLRNTVNNLIRMGKLLYENNYAFKREIPNSFMFNLNFNTTSFVMLNSFLSKMNMDFYPIENTVYRLIRVAKILYNNGRYIFNARIDPNFVKSISSNLINFVYLTREIERISDESDKRFRFIDIFKKDPMVQISKRMTKLADGYDRLASSLTRLSVAMKLLNISDFRVLTNTFIGDFTIGDIRRDIRNLQGNRGVNINRTTQSTQMSPIITPPFIKSKEVIVGEKIDKLIEILTKIEESTFAMGSSIKGMSMDKEVASPPNAGNGTNERRWPWQK